MNSHSLPLLLASRNPGKLTEMQNILQQILNSHPQDPSLHSFILYDLNQTAIDFTVTENGHTYAENAAKKALEYCQASGWITLADDSGLEADPLNGAPGLYSARYAPAPGASDEDRRNLLLSNLKNQPQPWSARFHCSIAIAVPNNQALPDIWQNCLRIQDHRIALAEGSCEGFIVSHEQGCHGFGYDPVFYLKEFNQTMAELEPVIKNRISHRAKAMQAAWPWLAALLHIP